MRRLSVTVLVLASALAGAIPAWAQGPPYTFTKINVAGSTKTEVAGINNAGVVAGTYFSPDGTVHAFTYNGTSYTTIDYPGAIYTFAFGINGAGQVVGSYAFKPGGPWFGMLWESGTFTSYQYSGQDTDGRAINTAGDIVGVWDVAGPPDHGYIKSGDTYTSIDVSGAAETYTMGINDAGTISGSYTTPDGRLHGFAMAGGQSTRIDAVGATHTFVGGLNNQHLVTGWAQNGLAVHGLLVDGTRTRLFDVDFPGAIITKGAAVNDSGQLVGTYVSTDCATCSFIATPRTDIAPTCDQKVTLQYTGGSLRLGFVNLRTSKPLTWNAYLYALNTLVPLWSIQLPALSPTSLEVPFAVPPIGTVLGLSTLVGADGMAVCSDYATVNTSATP